MKMTKIQFNVIRALAFAYGHEWAVGLDFAESWPRNAQPGIDATTRGATYAQYADPATAFRDDYPSPTVEDLATCQTWAQWIAMHAQIERGYVPTTEEIDAIATPLFDSDQFPSTPWVALDHETCSHQTRWSVEADGEVRFERWSAHPTYSTDPPRALMARALVWTSKSGQRVAMVDAYTPIAQWSEYERGRLSGMLVAAGASVAEATGAIEAMAFGGKRVCHFDLSHCAGVPIAA